MANNIKNELTVMEAEEFTKNNGIVMRMIATMFRRGWFRIRELMQTLTPYNMGVEDIMDAVDYFEDRKYIDCRDVDTKVLVRSCDAEIGDIELRLTADGKLLGYQLIKDDGIDL